MKLPLFDATKIFSLLDFRGIHSSDQMDNSTPLRLLCCKTGSVLVIPPASSRPSNADSSCKSDMQNMLFLHSASPGRRASLTIYMPVIWHRGGGGRAGLQTRGPECMPFISCKTSKNNGQIIKTSTCMCICEFVHSCRFVRMHNNVCMHKLFSKYLSAVRAHFLFVLNFLVLSFSLLLTVCTITSITVKKKYDELQVANTTLTHQLHKLMTVEVFFKEFIYYIQLPFSI